MKRLAIGFIAAALSVGLVACDNQNETTVETPEQQEPQPATPTTPTTPEANQPSAVPSEPLDPLNTPSEPPDAGATGTSDGAMVPEGSSVDPSMDGTGATPPEQPQP